ncbi:hypothetical protein [Ligilactobacillus ruminis]|uniref:Histidine kinase n=1 Tax=Ligilactobacillus ruminis TaxID=1623 RepID=A0A6A8H5P0_9LACO|nr:hypothetical protein [Ligilactobacillus ruminis]MSA21390.1 hypothetical protein [Ligilactobacillus ruminis]MSA21400.1 hypothetical protein [Ligilactobacillus ruminis]MSA23444.1 hypothetical protein [Ligilactobacillus ruminis]MSA23454.1 hypothetical protein [Ligilactobacillus ruminis]MSA25287.1 hypothetical protein [Ligilactobacillus ruminis]
MTETKNTDMATARKLTRIAQNLQALVGMMALVNISDDNIKSFFVNETLSQVIESLRNSITDVENLSDELVELDK